MRTVHEAEALRPSDSVSKLLNTPGSTAPGYGVSTSTTKLPRIKLKLSNPSKDSPGYEKERREREDTMRAREAVPDLLFDRDLGFDEHELAMPMDELYQLLRRQIHWAEQESKRFEKEWQIIKMQRKAAWREKESIFEDVILAELKAFKSTLNPEDLALAADGRDVSSILERLAGPSKSMGAVENSDLPDRSHSPHRPQQETPEGKVASAS